MTTIDARLSTGTYHKIPTIYKRDPETRYKTLLEGVYATDALEYLADLDWVFTEKIDGTNIRVMLIDGAVTFGGKSDRAQLPAPLVNRLNERFLPQAERMASVFDDAPSVCLYGEGYGGKIQSPMGVKYQPDQDFVLFDVRVGGWWLKRDAVADVAEKLGLDVVPLIGVGTLLDAVECVRAGLDSSWGEFAAEGLVARPVTELRDRAGRRVIAKIKARDFGADDG